MPIPARHTIALLAALFTGLPAGAQAPQVVRPPVAQYWMDVATHSMAGMPEMPGMGSMMPGFMGGGAAGNAWGNTRGMSPGRWLDLALHVRTKPAGVDALHAIPPGMRMAPNLPLIPLKPSATPPREREPDDFARETPERPSGRILIYWGCSETVRSGQPRIIDLATAGPAEFGRALGGRHAPERGPRIAPGYSLWPNETHRNPVPREASLNGEHAVSGDGVPASLRFAIGQQQDFMPPIDLATRGSPADSIGLQWPANPTARAHYLHAMGNVGKDMILWSSAEVPDTGMGLFDYLSNATIDRWLADKVLLRAAETRCAIPKGIFAGNSDSGGMLRMITFGNELNLVHPPRPSDPKIPWDQEWTARVRVKATTMAMLGEDSPAPARRRGAAPQGETSQPSATQSADQSGQPAPAQESTPSMPSIPGIPGSGRALDAIRGIFGR